MVPVALKSSNIQRKFFFSMFIKVALSCEMQVILLNWEST